jgi:hypothetical protein
MIRTVLKDPFVHFIILGFLVFIIADKEFIFPSEAASTENTILISGGVEQLIQLKFKANQGRLPNDSESTFLIENYIREEILVRESIKLGLDQDDHVIRSRLVELIDSIGLANNKVGTPNDIQLKELALKNPIRYSTGGSFSIEQVFLGNEPSEEFILNTQQSIEKGTSPSSLGVRSKFTFRLNYATKEAIIGMFGLNFFNTLMNNEIGPWSAPMRSPAGIHLVRIVSKVDPIVPPVDQIRDMLISDWDSLQKRQILDDIYQGYRSKYQVVYDQKSN